MSFEGNRPRDRQHAVSSQIDGDLDQRYVEQTGADTARVVIMQETSSVMFGSLVLIEAKVFLE
jgi:hypothetical protein